MDSYNIFVAAIVLVVGVVLIPNLLKTTELKNVNSAICKGDVCENIFDGSRVKIIADNYGRGNEVVLKYVKEGQNEVFESPASLFRNQYKCIVFPKSK